MKVKGALVDMLVEIDLETCQDYVTDENEIKKYTFKYSKQYMECYSQQSYSTKK